MNLEAPQSMEFKSGRAGEWGSSPLGRERGERLEGALGTICSGWSRGGLLQGAVRGIGRPLCAGVRPGGERKGEGWPR